MTRTTARADKTTARRHSKPSPSPHSGGGNRVKIVSGQYRGRWIDFPDSAGLRPTGNRIRETLFNWLGQRLDGRRCLDLFAGSGALGFEAASRGAQEVVMIESSAVVVSALKANRERLGASMCHVERADAPTWLARPGAPFDVIFADPPFSSGLMEKVLTFALARLPKDGFLYCEWGVPLEDILAAPAYAHWEIVRSGKAGVVHFALLKIRETDP